MSNKGKRYICEVGGDCKWVKPADLTIDDRYIKWFDCTDMTDDEFEDFILTDLEKDD